MGFAGGVDSVAGDTVADSKSDSGYSKVNESGGRDAVSRADVNKDSAIRSAANQDAIDRANSARIAAEVGKRQMAATEQARLDAEAAARDAAARDAAAREAQKRQMAEAEQARLDSVARQEAAKTLGIPSINLMAMGSGMVMNPPPVSPMSGQGTIGPRPYSSSMLPSEKARGAAQIRQDIEKMLPSITSKTTGVESGGNPKAQNELSSAGGLGQFINDTWMDMISKYRPDLLNYKPVKELTAEETANVLSLKKDPNFKELSIEMTANYARENALKLYDNNLPVTESNVYLSHFLGPGKATEVLRADPNTPISSIIDPETIRVNPSVLGGGKTVADVLSWSSKKMGGQAPPASTPTLVDTAVSAGKYVLNRIAAAPGDTIKFLTEAFDNDPQTKALEDQNRLAGGLTKQAYADLFADGDLSKVQSRIVDYGQGQQVDYYTKSLGDKFGEAASALGGSISNAGKGLASLVGFPAGTGDASYFGDIPTAVPQAETGYGPYGNLTREQYNEQYGGSDNTGIASLPTAPKPLAPTTPEAPPPLPPVYTTGIDFSPSYYQGPPISTETYSPNPEYNAGYNRLG